MTDHNNFQDPDTNPGHGHPDTVEDPQSSGDVTFDEGRVPTGTGERKLQESLPSEYTPFRPSDSFVYTGEEHLYQLNDGSRHVIFRGVQIAYLSSERPGVSRWTDMAMFKTVGGSYIVNRIGVSAVAHHMDCHHITNKHLPSAFETHEDEIAIEDRDPCPVCKPDIPALMVQDPAALKIEKDRHWAAVASSAGAIIESLQTTKAGVKSLSSLATGLIEMAAIYDPDINAALRAIVVRVA